MLVSGGAGGSEWRYFFKWKKNCLDLMALICLLFINVTVNEIHGDLSSTSTFGFQITETLTQHCVVIVPFPFMKFER